jgi:hypothetical protein
MTKNKLFCALKQRSFFELNEYHVEFNVTSISANTNVFDLSHRRCCHLTFVHQSLLPAKYIVIDNLENKNFNLKKSQYSFDFKRLNLSKSSLINFNTCYDRWHWRP